MHICHVIPNNVGGAPRVVDLLASAQSKAGHTVSIVVLNEQDSKWGLFTTADHVIRLDIKRIKFYLINFNLGYLYCEFLRIIQLKNVISKLQPDIVVTHTTNVIRSYYLIAKSLSIPYIAYVQSDLESEIRFELKKLKWQWLIDLSTKISLRSLNKAAGIVFVCQSLLERQIQLGLKNNNSIISYNPVLETDVEETSLHPTAASWLNNPNLTTFVSAARFEPQKDHETLLKAFTQVIQLYPNARLILLGDGHLMSKYQIMAESLKVSKYVLFLGYVSNPKSYFSLCKAVILSSHWEGLPLVLVEAVASGTTFIASDCPVGPRELAEILECGTLVKPGNIDELATAICSQIDNPKLPVIKAEVIEIFSEKTCIDKLDKLSKLVLRSR